MANSATKNIFSFNRTNNGPRYGRVLDFEISRWKFCQKFAKDVIDSNIEEYIRRGQDDPTKIIPQIRKGKILEHHTRDVFIVDYPLIGPVDMRVLTVAEKTFDPDLTAQTSLVSADGFSLAVKAKDVDHAEQYTPSWIFGTNDKAIFGPKLDGKNINPNQYACMGIVDDVCRECHLLCCVSIEWLHYWDLLSAPPDEKYLKKKVAVRFDYEERDKNDRANGVKTKFERNGIKYNSIMDIVRDHYDGDDRILWQL